MLRSFPLLLVLPLMLNLMPRDTLAEDGIALTRTTLAARVSELERANDLSRIADAPTWSEAQSRLREQLVEMLGLPPLETRDPELHAVITGTIEDEQMVVERIHFQSSLGLYVTGNLYRPKHQTAPLPAVLYVCGHGQVKVDGVSLGNKTYYQHHPAWFAEHGYVCLAIDTIQLGEIEGIHHGLYRFNRWDWPSRGYTPAGVEAWNALRAIDYLVSRPEVDASRIGITGRSGGGAYSWYTAAIDPRIRVAVPVAGITDLRDHVVGECVRGHCDCMYMVNRYGWDYSTLAAMVHPRALLIGNTDDDPIFPLDGVVRVHSQARKVYALDAKQQLGIQWTSGGHDDTQELQLGCFVWFDRFLQGERRPITRPATARLDRSRLRVLDAIPPDERVSTVQDWFVPMAEPVLPTRLDAWRDQEKQLRAEIAESVAGRIPFAAIETIRPSEPASPQTWFQASLEGLEAHVWDIDVPPASKCRCVLLGGSPPRASDIIQVIVGDASRWEQVVALQQLLEGGSEAIDIQDWIARNEIPKEGRQVVWVFPEGRGPWYWNPQDNVGLHLRRSYLLCGWSLEGRQIAGVVRALSQLTEQFPKATWELHSDPETEVLTLHAALLSPVPLRRVQLGLLPASYRDGFVLNGILRRCDLPQVLAAVAGRFPVAIDRGSPIDLSFADGIQQLTGQAPIQRD